MRGPDGTNYLITFMVVTSLFLLWGFAHGLLDVLNKNFQNILHISKAQSGFVQFSLYIGYLVMAVPAGSNSSLIDPLAPVLQIENNKYCGG